MSKLFDNIALEEESTKVNETELVIYAKIGKPEGLEEGTHKEEHLEFHGLLGKGKARVRMIDHLDGKPEYCFTLKVKQEKHDGLNVNIEHNLDVDKDFMEGFSQLADSKIEKTRYHFVSEKVSIAVQGDDNLESIELPEVIYEVDVFKKPDGSMSEWCKIEVEVDDILTFIDHNYPDLKNIKLNIKVSHLPFEPTESFNGKSEGHEDQERQLWETEFKTDLTQTPAPVVTEPAPVVEEPAGA